MQVKYEADKVVLWHELKVETWRFVTPLPPLLTEQCDNVADREETAREVVDMTTPKAQCAEFSGGDEFVFGFQCGNIFQGVRCTIACPNGNHLGLCKFPNLENLPTKRGR